MKYFFATGMLLAALIAASAGEPGKDGRAAGSSVREGWVDKDTFRVVAVGTPIESIKDRDRRRIIAREKAIRMAQYLIMEKFKGARIEGASGMSDVETTGMAVAKEFNAVLKGGYIVEETYNDKDECEIVYEVRSPGLKKKVFSFSK